MNTTPPNSHEQLALKRFAAISWIEQRIAEGIPLAQALRDASLRPWPDAEGVYYAWSTLEELFYLYRKGGFAALHPQGRSDQGQARKISKSVGAYVLEQVRLHPQLALTVHYRLWQEAGHALPSVSTIYRFLRRHGLDAQSLRRGRLDSGPTKSFEAPCVNDLWMTDFSPGPCIVLEDGRRLSTHLCVIIDDHSRLLCFGGYYPAADTRAFHHALKEAVQRRGVPFKLYTDQGKPFVCGHTRLVCANLGIRLLHAKPYHAWSKGKCERIILTIQRDFESTLRLPGRQVHSLEALNDAFSAWVAAVYHTRVHSSTGATPEQRYSAAAGAIRSFDATRDIHRIFYLKIERLVRRDGTVSIDSTRYEVDLCLRGLKANLFFDPFDPARPVEVFYQGRSFGVARPVNLHFNSQRA